MTECVDIKQTKHFTIVRNNFYYIQSPRITTNHYQYLDP